MRQQRHRPPKTLRVGMKRNVPERYSYGPYPYCSLDKAVNTQVQKEKIAWRAGARKGYRMHTYPQNQSYVGSSGQTLTTNVSMTLCDWQICHQAHVLCGRTTFVPNQIRYRIRTVPTPAVAWTRAQLIQEGGGMIHKLPHEYNTPNHHTVIHTAARRSTDVLVAGGARSLVP